MLARHGDIGACAVWVLNSSGDTGACWSDKEKWGRAGWALTRNGGMGACGADANGRETRMCLRWVLTSKGDMGVCWVGVTQTVNGQPNQQT